jgi:leucyl aminopeptidase
VTETTTLKLNLHSASASETVPGVPLTTFAEAEAGLSIDGDEVNVDLKLAPRGAAELRWITDKLMRQVSSLIQFESVCVNADTDIDDDMLLTIALDLHNRTGGQLEVAERPAVAEAVKRIGGYEDLYRDWVNEGPDDRTSLKIAADISTWAKDLDVEVEVLAEEELRAKNMNLLLAVGRGSTISPSRLVLAHYPGVDAGGDAPLLLVGKGVTFDTGGINVKPY